MAKITGFSEFEVKETSIRFSDEEEATKIGCVGTSEETLNSKVVTKKCEGRVAKTKVRGDGTGALKLSLHMKYDTFLKTYGMKVKGLKAGVVAYGTDSIHEAFCLTQKVIDEDGNEKLKAYPNCIVTSGISRKIENGAEEVAEIELEINLMPDENGMCMYEALVDETLDASIKTNWITKFKPEMVVGEA